MDNYYVKLKKSQKDFKKYLGKYLLLCKKVKKLRNMFIVLDPGLAFAT